MEVKFKNYHFGRWEQVGTYKMAFLTEDFERGSNPNTMFGYRVMEYDPSRNVAISVQDRNKAEIPLKAGQPLSYGKGHYLGSSKQFVMDYYGGLSDYGVVMKVEFDLDDIIQGEVTGSDGEIAVRKSTLVNWETFTDPDLEESTMTKFEKKYRKIMEDMVAGPGGAFGSGESIGGSYNPTGGPISGGDNYAPGDARVPKVIGAKESKKKNKKGKKGLKEGPPVDISIQRRVFPNM